MYFYVHLSLFSMMLYGASGGSGFRSKDTASMIRGTQYMAVGIRDIPLWPSQIHVRVHLEEGDQLFIVVGQAGGEACHKVNFILT